MLKGHIFILVSLQVIHYSDCLERSHNICYLDIQTVSTLEHFSGLDRDIESSPKRWRKIVESTCPETERLPQDWKNKSSFQKLIILRALRPDRMTYSLR